MGNMAVRRKKSEGSKNRANTQQDRDKKVAGMGLKWGKSGGVTEDQIGVFAVVSPSIPIVYERFSIVELPHFFISSYITAGYDRLGGLSDFFACHVGLSGIRG